MQSKLAIKRLADGRVFPVQKYIFDGQEHHIWCNDWYGHHKIFEDCQWAETSEERMQRLRDEETPEPPDEKDEHGEWSQFISA